MSAQSTPTSVPQSAPQSTSQDLINKSPRQNFKAALNNVKEIIEAYKEEKNPFDYEKHGENTLQELKEKHELTELETVQLKEEFKKLLGISVLGKRQRESNDTDRTSKKFKTAQSDENPTEVTNFFSNYDDEEDLTEDQIKEALSQNLPKVADIHMKSSAEWVLYFFLVRVQEIKPARKLMRKWIEALVILQEINGSILFREESKESLLTILCSEKNQGGFNIPVGPARYIVDEIQQLKEKHQRKLITTTEAQDTKLYFISRENEVDLFLQELRQYYKFLTSSKDDSHEPFFRCYDLSGSGKTSLSNIFVEQLPHRTVEEHELDEAIKTVSRLHIDFNSGKIHDNIQSVVETKELLSPERFLALRTFAHAHNMYAYDVCQDNMTQSKYRELSLTDIVTDLVTYHNHKTKTSSPPGGGQEPFLLESHSCSVQIVHLDEPQFLFDALPGFTTRKAEEALKTLKITGEVKQDALVDDHNTSVLIEIHLRKQFIKEMCTTLAQLARKFWKDYQIILVVMMTGTVSYPIDPTKLRPIDLPLSPLKPEKVIEYLQFRDVPHSIPGLSLLLKHYGLMPFLLSTVEIFLNETNFSTVGYVNEKSITDVLNAKLKTEISKKVQIFGDEGISSECAFYLCYCSLMQEKATDHQFQEEINKFRKKGTIQGREEGGAFLPDFIPAVTCLVAEAAQNKCLSENVNILSSWNPDSHLFEKQVEATILIRVIFAKYKPSYGGCTLSTLFPGIFQFDGSAVPDAALDIDSVKFFTSLDKQVFTTRGDHKYSLIKELGAFRMKTGETGLDGVINLPTVYIWLQYKGYANSPSRDKLKFFFTTAICHAKNLQAKQHYAILLVPYLSNSALQWVPEEIPTNLKFFYVKMVKFALPKVSFAGLVELKNYFQEFRKPYLQEICENNQISFTAKCNKNMLVARLIEFTETKNCFPLRPRS